MSVSREFSSVKFNDLPVGSIFVELSKSRVELMKIMMQDDGANTVCLQGAEAGFLGRAELDDTVMQVTRKYIEELVYASHPQSSR